ncbi:MAG: S9 family peptidase [Candidatus Acidiferrales bacterium]
MRHSNIARKLFILAFFAASAISAAPARAQSNIGAGKKLTVERMFSAPSLSGSLVHGIEWSPDGKRVSYFQRTGSGRDAATDLWVMDASSGQKSVLVSAKMLGSLLEPEKQKATQGTGLARATPQDYQWAPDGKGLLFVSDTQLVWLDLASMSRKLLISGEQEIEDSRLSPDGKWVSFVQNFNLWTLNLASGEKMQLTQGGSEEILKAKLDWVYPEELSSRTAYWWSPDSTRIAYFEMDERPVRKYAIYDMSSDVGGITITRYPQAGEPNPIVRVGVIPVGGGETKWMDTGADTNVYLARVNWLPDAKQISIERLNRAQTRLDLLLCDATTGASKSVLTEEDPYWINVSDDLYFFSDSQRFLWSSERNDYRLIYLYDISGKLLKQVTTGDWNVTSTEGFGPRATNGLIVDEARGEVFFHSDKGNPLETQLYRVSLADGTVKQITQGAGVHEAVLAPDASAYVELFSRAETPPRQSVYRADGKLVATLLENKVPELDEYKLPRVEFTTIKTADGATLYASMIKPSDFDATKKYPVLVEVYGGPGAQSVKDQWNPGQFWSKLMAQRGYIVWSLDNRGSLGRGHKFESPIYHHFGKLELDDQVAGVNYLKSLPYVDAKRIGVWGWSYGGYMTLQALFHASDVFKTGVAVAPVTDWHLYDTIYTERYMGLPKDNEEGYRDSSPANFTQNLKGHLMVAHGTGDDNVHFANTALILNKFIDADEYPELMIFPGRGHPIGDRAAQVDLFNRIEQFLLNNL